MRLSDFQKGLKKDPRFIEQRLKTLAAMMVEVATEALTLGYSLEELADIAREHGLVD